MAEGNLNQFTMTLVLSAEYLRVSSCINKVPVRSQGWAPGDFSERTTVALPQHELPQELNKNGGSEWWRNLRENHETETPDWRSDHMKNQS